MSPRVAVVAKVVVAMAWVLPWIELIGLMWIGSAPFAALGVLIGLAISDAGGANTATNFAFVVLWLLGGIFTPAGDMPEALAVISRKLPSSGILEMGDSVAHGTSIP